MLGNLSRTNFKVFWQFSVSGIANLTTPAVVVLQLPIRFFKPTIIIINSLYIFKSIALNIVEPTKIKPVNRMVV